jgi:hypothetical protein
MRRPTPKVSTAMSGIVFQNMVTMRLAIAMLICSSHGTR